MKFIELNVVFVRIYFVLCVQVKNKAPAEVQITAEQLLREAKERELELLPPPPKQKITDAEELNDYKLKKRKVRVLYILYTTTTYLAKNIYIYKNMTISWYIFGKHGITIVLVQKTLHCHDICPKDRVLPMHML